MPDFNADGIETFTSRDDWWIEDSVTRVLREVDPPTTRVPGFDYAAFMEQQRAALAPFRLIHGQKVA